MDDLEVVKWVDGLANGNPRVAHTGGVKSNSSSDSSRVAFRFCVMKGRIARDRLQARGGRQRQRRRRRQEQTRVEGGKRGQRTATQRVSINGKHTATPRRRAPAEQIMKNHEIL